MFKRIIYLGLKIAPFLYMGSIWVMSSLPQDAVINTPYPWDQAFKESLHLIAFGILYILFALFFYADGKLTHKTSMICAAIAISYGFIDELHQYFVPFRSATVIDLVKNIIGVLVGYYLVRRFYLTKKGV